ncbi:MAG TPA: hypothetical protein VFJ58_05005 [Armatimonadota bacterium]|nr:hypothetical protein [Armatimonadota bacterium]
MFEGILDGIGGLSGWALAAGVVVIAGPAVARRLRPVAKGAIKGYLALTAQVRDASEGARASMQDLVNEARSENAAGSPDSRA